jgi:hypothetical protein
MQLGDRGLDMFEKHLGKWPTKILIFCIGLGAGGYAISIFVTSFVLPLASFVRGNLPASMAPEINLITAIYVAAFVAIVALVIPIIFYLLQKIRPPQRVIDDLAELRSAAIHDILNGKVRSNKDLAVWEKKEDIWCQQVLGILRKNFSKAEVLDFDRLGVIPQVGFGHSFNNQHSFRLMMFAKRLSILEDIIRRHTR